VLRRNQSNAAAFDGRLAAIGTHAKLSILRIAGLAYLPNKSAQLKRNVCSEKLPFQA